jgi:hypothetical protein
MPSTPTPNMDDESRPKLNLDKVLFVKELRQKQQDAKLDVTSIIEFWLDTLEDTVDLLHPEQPDAALAIQDSVDAVREAMHTIQTCQADVQAAIDEVISSDYPLEDMFTLKDN